MAKSDKTMFLNRLHDTLMAAVVEIDGTNVWAGEPLDEPCVAGLVVEYEGRCYVVEIFAEDDAEDDAEDEPEKEPDNG